MTPKAVLSIGIWTPGRAIDVRVVAPRSVLACMVVRVGCCRAGPGETRSQPALPPAQQLADPVAHSDWPEVSRASRRTDLDGGTPPRPASVRRPTTSGNVSIPRRGDTSTAGEKYAPATGCRPARIRRRSVDASTATSGSDSADPRGRRVHRPHRRTVMQT
jgi:hypothetical protein